MGRAQSTRTGFEGVFGTRRGPMRVYKSPEQTEKIERLLEDSDLAGACRVIRLSPAFDEETLVPLCDALAAAALEDRWGGRVRAVHNLTGVLVETAPQTLGRNGDIDDGDNEHHLHLTEERMDVERVSRWEIPDGTRTLCGRTVKENNHSYRRVIRGSWLDPAAAIKRGAKGKPWEHCEGCQRAAASAEIPDATEVADYEVMTRPEFSSARTALSHALQDALHDDPRKAKLAFVRQATDHCEQLVIRGCARAAAKGGRGVWETALCVTEKNWGSGRGLTYGSVDDYLGRGADPSEHLDESDWEEALGAMSPSNIRGTKSLVSLARFRGQDSPKQMAQFRKVLWNKTLDRVYGPDREHNGVCF